MMWRFLLPGVPAALGAMALKRGTVPLKVSVAAANALVAAATAVGLLGAPRSSAAAVAAAFAVSAVGDYFMATRRQDVRRRPDVPVGAALRPSVDLGRRPDVLVGAALRPSVDLGRRPDVPVGAALRPSVDLGRFLAGIGAFLVALTGYLLFALLEGRMSWVALLVLLAGYLPYYFVVLRPAIRSGPLAAAALVYLLAACVTLAAAFGVRLSAAPRALYVVGIALLVFSDTIISLDEFLRLRRIAWLILPTYYLGQIAVLVCLLLGSYGI